MNIKKKIVLLLLALALTIGFGVTQFAASDVTVDSSPAIEIAPGNGNGGPCCG